MESPFYEMNHDIETERQIATKSYQQGYSAGCVFGQSALMKYLLSLTDEQLIAWRNGNKQISKLVNDMVNSFGPTT